MIDDGIYLNNLHRNKKNFTHTVATLKRWHTHCKCTQPATVWQWMTVYHICICQVSQATPCRWDQLRPHLQGVPLVVLITYLQTLVSVAQAQLPAGHHGLRGGPALSADQTPALRPVWVQTQDLHAALVTSPSPCESDLCGAEELGATEQSRDTQGPNKLD